MRKKKNFVLIVLLAAGLLVGGNVGCNNPGTKGSRLKFTISFPAEANAGPITGRVYAIITKTDRREPRFQVSTRGVPFFGLDIVALEPGAAVVIDNNVLGYPLKSLEDIPAGEYFVQGFVNIYTEFKRADGHTLWMHQDQWEGQRWSRSPGNLYSEVRKVFIDPAQGGDIQLVCDQVIPPVTVPADTKWIKRIKFQSQILTKFWGQPMYLGATILLPRSYVNNPQKFYPVNYIQGHFSLRSPYGFTAEEPEQGNFRGRRGYEFYKYWISEKCPEMIAVTFQHPCPYYDDSYAVNSPNVGPYGDAIMQELIPYLEENFRMIREPYARILSGGSTGGWISLALQIFYPDFFGGVFSLCPDPVDFSYFQCINIYKDKNAYYKEIGDWLETPTASDRRKDGIVTLTSEQRNLYELILGTKGRSGEQTDIFEAAYGPLGPDGYFKPLFDPLTGEIDPEVADYWKINFDLRYILETKWAELGPKLKGKIHIYTGDMDTFYLNNAVVLMESFLEKTKDPYYSGVIEYGDGQPHCWGPRGPELLELMADHIAKNRRP